MSMILSGCNYESQSEKNYEYCQAIYDGLCNKDIEGIAKYFCETTKKTHDLEEEIQGAFEFIDGDIVSYDNFLISSGGEKVRDGEVVEKHSSPRINRISTNTGKVYKVVIQNREICLEYPEYEGFSQISIFYVNPDLDVSDWEEYDIGEYIDYKINY